MSAPPTTGRPADSLSPPAVIHRPEDLTASWLTAALRAGGLDVRVTETSAEPIGAGLMSANLRVHLQYEVAGSGPDTLVAKLPAPDLEARTTAGPGYRAEVAFYTDVASTVAARTPDCYFGAISESGAEFVLLLEDLSPAEPGDQIRGCGRDHAEDAVVNLAGLHGPRWCDETLRELSFLNATDQGVADFFGDLAVSATEVFAERFAAVLSAEDVATMRAAAASISAFLLGRPERFGVVHGDYRLDNLLFPPPGERGAIAVDWQTLALGLPARDLAYFLATSLEIHERRAHEDHLVASYHRALLGHGVTGYSLELCHEDYRFGLLQAPLIITLGAAYGSHTERADELFPTMARRACAAIRDLAALALY